MIGIFPRRGALNDITAVTFVVQRYIDTYWLLVWHEHVRALERIYEQSGGERVSIVYHRALFRPLDDELRQTHVICQPPLPGAFSASLETWGPSEECERRFWCTAYDGKVALGSLVTRLFHDDTHLCIPRPPIVVAYKEENLSEEWRQRSAPTLLNALPTRRTLEQESW